MATAKIAAHWLTTGLPLLLAAPVLAVLLNMPGDGFLVLIIAMAIGTPALSLIGAVGAALTLSVRRGGVLLSLLVLPLYIPVLIFGVSAIDATLIGLSAKPHLLLLAAVGFVALPLCPLAAAAAVRLSFE
jgi:heme exporter protein B